MVNSLIDIEAKKNTGASLFDILRRYFSKISFFLSLVASIIILFYGKSNEDFSDSVRSFVFNTSKPLLITVNYPFKTAFEVFSFLGDLVNLREKNLNLERENILLKKEISKLSYLNYENRQLKDLMRHIPPKSVKYKTVRVISNNVNSYSSNVLIDAGIKKGIEKGQILLGKEGVIGRVLNPGDNISRVSLLTDFNSKIPVITVHSKVKAILKGNNSNLLEMQNIFTGSNNIRLQEEVFTSGDGNYFPPGLLVGKVIKIKDDSVFVKIADDINNLDLISVIEY